MRRVWESRPYDGLLIMVLGVILLVGAILIFACREVLIGVMIWGLVLFFAYYEDEKRLKEEAEEG